MKDQKHIEKSHASEQKKEQEKGEEIDIELINPSLQILDDQNKQSLDQSAKVILSPSAFDLSIHQISKQNSTNLSQYPPKNIILSTVQSKYQLAICKICEKAFSVDNNTQRELYLCLCQHKFDFCESCINHYAIYKIQCQKKVFCPAEGCEVEMDGNSKFFGGLPIEVQRKYRRYRQFMELTSDPFIIICQQQNCFGILKKDQQESSRICAICQQRYCLKCSAYLHEGECQNVEDLILQKVMRYKRCQRCQVVIEKNQGCNHITCLCGYQFCYVCGKQWTYAHLLKHDQNGELIAPAVPVQNTERIVFPLFECGCLTQRCGPIVSAVILAPLKGILFLVFSIFMVGYFIIQDFFAILVMATVSIFLGIFLYSFEQLCELQSWKFVLGLLGFPFLMIVGIKVGFREIFSRTVCEKELDTVRLFRLGVQRISLI